MKYRLLFFVFFLSSCLFAFGQTEINRNEKPQQNVVKSTTPKQTQGATFGEKVNSGLNSVKTKVEADRSFREPYQVEIFSSGERGQGNVTVVNGLTVKGSVIAASVSSLSGGGGGGAASASYAKLQVTISQAESGDKATTYTDANGNFTVTLSRDTLHTIFVNGVEYGKVKLKTKHDTVKNSINNVR